MLSVQGRPKLSNTMRAILFPVPNEIGKDPTERLFDKAPMMSSSVPHSQNRAASVMSIATGRFAISDIATQAARMPFSM